MCVSHSKVMPPEQVKIIFVFGYLQTTCTCTVSMLKLEIERM